MHTMSTGIPSVKLAGDVNVGLPLIMKKYYHIEITFSTENPFCFIIGNIKLFLLKHI